MLLLDQNTTILISLASQLVQTTFHQSGLRQLFRNSLRLTFEAHFVVSPRVRRPYSSCPITSVLVTSLSPGSPILARHRGYIYYLSALSPYDRTVDPFIKDSALSIRRVYILSDILSFAGYVRY